MERCMTPAEFAEIFVELIQHQKMIALFKFAYQQKHMKAFTMIFYLAVLKSCDVSTATNRR